MSRAKWKGPFIKHPGNRTITKIHIQNFDRQVEITPQDVGVSAKVYKGNGFTSFVITDEMIGHKMGELAPTRERFMFKKKRKK
jgi:small subunit ribosomal protein S19